MHGARIAVSERDQSAVFILPAAAHAGLPVGQNASVRAEIALDRVVPQRVPVFCRMFALAFLRKSPASAGGYTCKNGHAFNQFAAGDHICFSVLWFEFQFHEHLRVGVHRSSERQEWCPPHTQSKAFSQKNIYHYCIYYVYSFLL